MAMNRKMLNESKGKYSSFSGLLDDHLNALLNLYKQFAEALNNQPVSENEELLSRVSISDKAQLAMIDFATNEEIIRREKEKELSL